MADYFIGEIRMFSFNFAPNGWAFCQGQTMQIQQNAALYALLGVQFGGNGSTTFLLPDLRGRTPLCIGRSPISGTVYQQGSNYAGGSEGVTLAANQVPTHNHTLKALSTQGTAAAPTDALISTVKQTGTPPASAPIYGVYSPSPATPLTAINPGTVSSVGGAAHSNMQPFTVANFCISLTGVFPSRN